MKIEDFVRVLSEYADEHRETDVTKVELERTFTSVNTVLIRVENHEYVNTDR